MKLLNINISLILLLFNVSYGQVYKTSKIIVDKQTKKPLEFVNINNDFDNTISNVDGSFLFLSKKNVINISSLGYKSISTTFDFINTIDTLFLEHNPIELNEIVVTNTTSLLNDVYRNISYNYPMKSYNEIFFLRCLLKKNGEICRLQDVFGRIERNTLFVNQTIKDDEYKAEISNMRKVEIADKNKIEYVEFPSFKNLFRWYASIFTIPSDYNFTKVQSNDQEYFKIEYTKNDKNTNNVTRNGYYIINKKDKSIKEVSFKLTGETNKIPYIAKNPLKWKTIESELLVNFIKNPTENKYYIGNAKLRTVTEIINESNDQKDIFEATYELITIESFTDNKIKPNFSVDRDLFKAKFPYSEDFWNNQNQLPLTNELKTFLRRIAENKSNKSVYKIIGNF
jgi:hypothetical protein